MNQPVGKVQYDFELFVAVTLYFLPILLCLALIGPLRVSPFQAIPIFIFVTPPAFSLAILGAQFASNPRRWSWRAVISALAAIGAAAWFNAHCLFEAAATI